MIAQTIQITRLSPIAIVMVVTVVIWILLMWTSAMKNHKAGASAKPKTCGACATENPGHAAFCRNCGKKF